ncbi:hypothetical protein MTsPCn5_21650 [Croceitalea sp. MTPC5]|uniref:porin family protein n=1 Tax=Croceitalea sp. MTPC5 TaxID=3056565 RepID=UPI002B3D59C1|nr:hypothetical protein MTsPCn5_21650 [Croceitalea sp. MTPC5]
MKKRPILILILILSVRSIIAQTTNNVEFGLKIGANYTVPKMVDLKSMEFNNQLGLDLGLFSDFMFNNRIGLKLELLYTSQNINMESYGFNDGNGGRTETAELNQEVKDEYLTLPILFKLKLINRLDFSLGPQLGLLISNNERFLVNDGIIFFQNEQLDHFSISGDLDLSFHATDRLNLSIRYFLGLNKVNSLRNNGLQFHLGYAIL